MLFTLPICDEFIQLSLLKAQETFLAFHVGKRVETSDRIKVELTKHRETCPKGSIFQCFILISHCEIEGSMLFFIAKQTKFHIFMRENQVLLDGPEGRESFKKFLGKVLNAVPGLATIVGPLAGHLLLQMLHITLINGLCYPCSMHAHCPSDHSLFPWSICHHPNYPFLHT
jgi:hypothetical protein